MRKGYKVFVTMRVETEEDKPAEFEYETYSQPWLDLPENVVFISTGRPEDKNYDVIPYDTRGIFEIDIINQDTDEIQRLTINPNIITKEEIEILEKEYKEVK